MIAYQFSNENGHYVGPYPCQLDPVASRLAGKDMYLLPANATLEPPPAYDSERQTVVWSGEGWTVECLPEPEPVEAQNASPSAVEQLRADVDYLAALAGVEL